MLFCNRQQRSRNIVSECLIFKISVNYKIKISDIRIKMLKKEESMGYIKKIRRKAQTKRWNKTNCSRKGRLSCFTNDTRSALLGQTPYKLIQNIGHNVRQTYVFSNGHILCNKKSCRPNLQIAERLNYIKNRLFTQSKFTQLKKTQ